MRAPISIVIPTLNAAAELPGTMASLAEGLDAGLIRELIVTDGGSTDDTRHMAEAAGAEWITGAPGRGGQLQRGVTASAGAWVLVIHADTQLSAGWSAAVLQHLQDKPKSAGYFKLRFRSEGLAPAVVARWANRRSKWFGLPYGDQGLLVPRVLYDAVGGYPDIPLMEDVALARALRRQLSELDATVWTSAARYERDGWVRRGARNLLTLGRFFAGVDPAKLAVAYRR